MPKMLLAWNEKEYPVSDATAAELDAVFPERWPSLAEAKGLIGGLLSLGEDLSEDERRAIRACDMIVNMNSAVRYLKGRDHTEMFEFIDQVHGNKWEMACGCHLSVLFDHHLRMQPEKIVHHPHYPHRVCRAHAHLKDDFKEHHRVVLEEHRQAQAEAEKKRADPPKVT